MGSQLHWLFIYFSDCQYNLKKGAWNFIKFKRTNQDSCALLHFVVHTIKEHRHIPISGSHLKTGNGEQDCCFRAYGRSDTLHEDNFVKVLLPDNTQSHGILTRWDNENGESECEVKIKFNMTSSEELRKFSNAVTHNKKIRPGYNIRFFCDKSFIKIPLQIQIV